MLWSCGNPAGFGLGMLGWKHKQIPESCLGVERRLSPVKWLHPKSLWGADPTSDALPRSWDHQALIPGSAFPGAPQLHVSALGWARKSQISLLGAPEAPIPGIHTWNRFLPTIPGPKFPLTRPPLLSTTTKCPTDTKFHLVFSPKISFLLFRWIWCLGVDTKTPPNLGLSQIPQLLVTQKHFHGLFHVSLIPNNSGSSRNLWISTLQHGWNGILTLKLGNSDIGQENLSQKASAPELLKISWIKPFVPFIPHSRKGQEAEEI